MNDYPLFINHSIDLTNEIITRIDEIQTMLDNIDEDIQPKSFGRLMKAADRVTEIVNQFGDVLTEISDTASYDESEEYDDVYTDEDIAGGLTECVSKILDGHRLGYISLPESLVDDLQESLDLTFTA